MQNTIEKVSATLATTSAHYSLQDLRGIGKIFHDSGLFTDLRGEAQFVTKILAGQELGFMPFQSLNGIYIVKGKVSIGANLMAARVKASTKYDFRVTEMSNTICAIEFFEQGQSIGVSSFTIQEARAAGTQNTDKFPRNMLFARAMSNGIRWYCPDVFMTPMYTPEELGAPVNEDGEPIQMAALHSIAPAESPALPPPSPINKAQAQTIQGLAKGFWGDEWKAELETFVVEGYGATTKTLTFQQAEQIKAALSDALANLGGAEDQAVEGEIEAPELSELDSATAGEVE